MKLYSYIHDSNYFVIYSMMFMMMLMVMLLMMIITSKKTFYLIFFFIELLIYIKKLKLFNYLKSLDIYYIYYKKICLSKGTCDYNHDFYFFFMISLRKLVLSFLCPSKVINEKKEHQIYKMCQVILRKKKLMRFVLLMYVIK